MNKFKQELASPSAITNITQGVSIGRGSSSDGSYHHARGRGKQFKGRDHERQTQVYTPGNSLTYQLCNKYCHSMIEYWHGFDEYYEAVPSKN